MNGKPTPDLTIGDVLDVVVELAGRVDVLTDQVDDLTRIVLRLERDDRNRRRQQYE